MLLVHAGQMGKAGNVWVGFTRSAFACLLTWYRGDDGQDSMRSRSTGGLGCIRRRLSVAAMLDLPLHGFDWAYGDSIGGIRIHHAGNVPRISHVVRMLTDSAGIDRECVDRNLWLNRGC